MTSGIPFSPQEIAYVKAHSPKEFPSVIARGLATKFREYNGGTRSTKAVAMLMKKIWEGSQASDTDHPVITIEEPKPKPDMRKTRRKKTI